MNLNMQKRIASEILKCGQSRVWINPASQEKVGHAITRRDVRGLIKDGLVRKLPEKKSLRTGPRFRMIQKAKGRRSNAGSRKGAIGARSRKKERWLKIIRPQRKLIRELKKEGRLLKGGIGKTAGGIRSIPQLERGSDYGILYRQVKGGAFRSKRHLVSHLEEHKLAKITLSEFEAKEKARKAETKQHVIKICAREKGERVKKQEEKANIEKK